MNNEQREAIIEYFEDHSVFDDDEERYQDALEATYDIENILNEYANWNKF